MEFLILSLSKDCRHTEPPPRGRFLEDPIHNVKEQEAVRTNIEHFTGMSRESLTFKDNIPMIFQKLPVWAGGWVIWNLDF